MPSARGRPSGSRPVREPLLVDLRTLPMWITRWTRVALLAGLLAGIVGANEKAGQEYMFGLDYVRLRPISPATRPASGERGFSVREYGAVGDGKTKDTRA